MAQYQKCPNCNQYARKKDMYKPNWAPSRCCVKADKRKGQGEQEEAA